MVFRAVLPRRGDKGRDDRKFLEALHYFTVHNITGRALPAEFGDWNAVWKRFWRLSRSGVFDAMFEALAATSSTAHLVQMLDSTTARAHVSAAGSKGGKTAKLLAARAAASRPRSAAEVGPGAAAPPGTPSGPHPNLPRSSASASPAPSDRASACLNMVNKLLIPSTRP